MPHAPSITINLRKIILIGCILPVLSLGCMATSRLVDSRDSSAQTLVPTEESTLIWSTPLDEPTQTAQPVGTDAVTAAPTQAAKTPPPPSQIVTVQGVVQEIHITSSGNIIVVNNIQYHVPQAVLVVIMNNLRVGVPIVFTSGVDASGVIIIVNVIKINNVTIIVNPQHKGGGDEGDDNQGDDD
jgi:hypothetical protein